MIPPHVHLLHSSLLALPVAAALTRRLLLNHKAPALIKSDQPAEEIKRTYQRPQSLSERLKKITGYHHHGLNE